MKNRKENFLLIVADQLRADCLGCYGMYPVKTPHLDALAKRGVRFTNAYTPQPLCCPSRQSLFSSQRPERDKAICNFDFLDAGHIAPNPVYWANRMRQMGYRNHYFGKWHVSPEHTPIDFGYETYVSPSDYRAFRTKKYGSYKKGDWFGGIDNVPTKDSPTHWLAEAAAQTIRGYEGKDEPWHISLMFSEPHLPCKPTKEFYDLYDPAQIPEWAGFRENFENKPYIQRQQLCSWGVEDYTWEDWREIVARYYAVITQMDDAIGKVLDALEESGQLENTLVVFCSDHGDMCGSHRMMDKHYVLYDDVVRVPLMISLPGFSMEDCVEEAFVYQTLDLGPTIMEILGETLQQTDGRSLLPLLTGEPCADWRKEVVATYNGQQFGLYTQRMIRTNEWKYIWNTTDVDELYDMVQDQGELHNRIYDPACQVVLSDLRKRLYEALKEQKDFLAASEFASKQLLGQVKKI